jgi:uncharacterized membrane protein YozB (DUF420 family)
MDSQQTHVADAKANKTRAAILVSFCLCCTALSVGILCVDMLIPPPWGGMTDSEPWVVVGLMAFVNSLSFLLVVAWLARILPWRLLAHKLVMLARATWRDFHYWTVGDCKETA